MNNISLQSGMQQSSTSYSALPGSDRVAESTHLAKKVSEHTGDAPGIRIEKKSLGSRVWSSIKSTPGRISIFCRSVYKVVLVGYYFAKHRVFGVEFTSNHLNSCLQKLGPAYAKVLQTAGSDEGLLGDLVDYLGSTESDREEFARVIRDFLDNNPEIPADVARSILDRAGSKGHVIKKHLATGTIGSCFEVEKDGQAYVAKVVPDWKASNVESGIRSMRMLCPFMPKVKTTIKELTDSYMDECNLLEERQNHIKFKDTLSKVERTGILGSALVPQRTTLTFKVPDLIEDVQADNLLFMEKIHDGYTINALSKPENRELWPQLYQKCFGEPMPPEYPFEKLLEDIHQQTKNKWFEMMKKHGVVHADCHPGNIMLGFKPGGQIDVWFVDFGNCLILSEDQRKLYSEILKLLDKLTDSFAYRKLDESGLDKLVNILWDVVAVSHKNKGPESKEAFKNALRTRLIKARDPREAIDQSRNLTPAEKEILKERLGERYVQKKVKFAILSLASASLSAVCRAEGLQLSSSFTRYVGAHFRTGFPLDAHANYWCLD